MATQQLEAKYINNALLRDLLTRLFGAGQFRINVSLGPRVSSPRLKRFRQTVDDNYVLDIPRRLTRVEHFPAHRLRALAYKGWLGRGRIYSKEIGEYTFLQRQTRSL